MMEKEGEQTFIPDQGIAIHSIVRIASVLLITVGNIIPWRCYSGFTTFCERGIEYARFKILFQNSDAVLASVGVLVLLALLVDRSNKRNSTFVWATIGIFISAFVGLNFYLDIEHSYGFYFPDAAVVVFSALSVWFLFRPVILIRYDKRIVILIVCLILGTAWSLIRTIMLTPLGSLIDEGLIPGPGLPLIGIGAVLALVPFMHQRQSKQ